MSKTISVTTPITTGTMSVIVPTLSETILDAILGVTNSPTNSQSRRRLRNKSFHLTYSTCIPPFEYIEWVKFQYLVTLEQYSVVNEKCSDGSEYTHALLCFAKTMETRQRDFFDYGLNHPNVRTVSDKTHINRIVCYHTSVGTPYKETLLCTNIS